MASECQEIAGPKLQTFYKSYLLKPHWSIQVKSHGQVQIQREKLTHTDGNSCKQAAHITGGEEFATSTINPVVCDC